MIKIKVPVLQCAMAERCLNPTDLAKLAGLSDATVSRITTRGEFASVKSFGLICRALNLKPTELIQDED